MLLSRFFMMGLATLLLAGLPASSSADDTKDFLTPDAWEGLKEFWTIEGNTVTGKAEKDPKFNTFFCSKKKYSDFEMSFKVQLVEGKGNSGIQLRSKLETGENEKGKFVVGGPQADIGAGYWGSLYGERFGGMMKQSSGETIKKVVKDKEFNDYSIRAVGKKVTITINGSTMVEDDFPKMPADGIIAFQLHAGGPMTVIFKEIKFTDLSKK